MPWDRTVGTSPKYRTPEHRAYLASLKAELKRHGALTCSARECVLPTRDIVNPNGMDPDGLTAGHNDQGNGYDGPQHRLCNTRDGAKRGRARQNSSPETMPLTPGLARPGG